MDFGGQNGRVSFGATEKQVVRTLGAPTVKHGGCWDYSTKNGTLNGEYLGGVDAMRYCFGPGPAGGQVVTTVFEHIVPHRLQNKKWYPGGWNPMMTLLKRPQKLSV